MKKKAKLILPKNYIFVIWNTIENRSPKKAKEFADILGYSPEQFVCLALQDSLNQYNIPMHVGFGRLIG